MTNKAPCTALWVRSVSLGDDSPNLAEPKFTLIRVGIFIPLGLVSCHQDLLNTPLNTSYLSNKYY